ncbi:Dynamin family protein [Streptomyces sp. TLI_053]|uniref:dynamin family protein n=1 Tax=Streptomyces sp. TLI_053 TaxID=1855352 RepID=UPI00087C6711|nr:dynamin family protein [Streptomyces sp. TLI_053]SDS91135.1 Dynamin family protein [Streptomyces sp. TLI_053]
MTPPRPEAPSRARVLDFAARTADLLERAARTAVAEAPSDGGGSNGSSNGNGSDPDNGSASHPGDGVRRLRDEAARAADGAATLVVVGEKKRGKSSTINSLVGVPDLLPVDADVATGVHIAVRYGEHPRAVAHLRSDGDAPEAPPRAEPVPLERIAEYAAVDPRTGRPRRLDVHHVEVELPVPLLAAGLELVDTPGVGGLVGGHAELALAALENADALVFVVDGSSELTRSELEFLGRATERTAETVFVLTKTDSYDAWPAVVERNRELLARHAPRHAEAPWFPVSNRARRDAVAAADSGELQEAAELLEESGFEPLKALLRRRIAARAAELRLANVVHVALAALAVPLAEQELRLRSLQQEPGLAAEVERAEEALRLLQPDSAQWRRALTTGSRDLKNTLQLGFRRSLNDIRRVAEAKIATSEPAALAEEFPAELEAQVEAVWLQLDNAARRGLAVLEERVRRECSTVLDTGNPDGRADGGAGGPGPGAELALVEEGAVIRAERGTLLPEMVHSTHRDGGPLGMIENVIPSVGTAATFGTVIGLLTSSVLLPAVASYAMLAVLTRRRRQRAELGRVRGDATRHLNRVLTELSTEIPAQITDHVDELADRLGLALDRAIADERLRLERRLAEHRRNLAASAAELAAARDRTKRRIGALTTLRDEGLALAHGLAATGRPDPDRS